MKKIISLIVIIGLCISPNIWYSYLSQEKVSNKTNILMSKYPTVKETVDKVLWKFYVRIEKYNIESQKKIYIKLQERIELFKQKEKYKDNDKAILLLNYLLESIAVQVYNIENPITEEIKKDVTQEEEVPEAIENTPVTTSITPQGSSTQITVSKSTITDTTQSINSNPINTNSPSQGNQTENSTTDWEFTTENSQETSISENESWFTENWEVMTSNTNTPIQDSENLPTEDIIEEEQENLFTEETQTILINEIWRFINNTEIEISSIILDIVWDRDFSFLDNTVYIRDEQWNTITESSDVIIIWWNYYVFVFTDFTLPEWIITFETNQLNINTDASTEIRVTEISIPNNPEVEEIFLWQILALKNRIDLFGSEEEIINGETINEQVEEIPAENTGSGSTN